MSLSHHQVCPIPDTLTALQGIGNALAEAQRENPLAPAWLIMPAALVPVWQRGQESCLNVRTGNFAHVSQWVLDRAGKPPIMLAGARRQRFLQRLVLEVHDRMSLQVLGGSVSLPGFSRHLGRWLDEMRQQEIAPAHFQAHADATGDPRDQDLALLYRSHEERLSASQWLDEVGAIVQACQVLQEQDPSFLSLAFLGITGYVQFSPLQTHLIRSLAACVQASRIFLPARRQPPEGKDLMARTAEALGFAYANDQAGNTGGNPAARQQMEAPSQEQEVRSVLRAIKRLLVVDKVPVADISLCVARMDSYAPLLHAIAEEFGIPLNVPVTLSRHPLYVILRQVLTLFPDLSWRQGWQVLRSPCLHQSFLTAQELDTVYRLTVACGVIRGQEQWDAAFTQDHDWWEAGRHLQDWADTDLPDLHTRLAALWAALQPQAGQSYLDWVQALLAHDSSHPVRLVVPDMLPASEQPGWQFARDTILQAVTELQEEGVRTSLGAEAVVRDCLLQQLADIEYRSLNGEEAVRVLAFQESWMLPSAYLFVLGMNERSLPRTPNAGPFYSWQERRGHALPLESYDPGIDKLRWTFLQANCRTVLHLSRPTDVADMPSTAPSPYWNPEAPCTRLARILVPPPDQAASPAELLQALLRYRAAEYPLPLQEPMAKARTLAHITGVRHAYAPAGPYEGILRQTAIQQNLRTEFGANHAWSPTALGDYARCPMGFLIKHVLRLAPPRAVAPGIDARIRGLLLHEMLQELYRWIRDEQVTMVNSNWDRIRCRLDRICDEQWAEAGLRYRFQPYPLAQFEMRELKRYVQWCIRNELAESADRMEWEPWELEWNIAGAGIVITEGVDQPFRIRGIVDRMDRNREGQIRVIDYKSRKADYTRTELNLALSNQAVLYRLAAMEAGYEVQESGYRMLGRTEDGKLQNVPGDDLATAMLERIQRHQAAVRRGEFPNAPGMLDDGGRRCSGYCELADFCQPTYSSARKAGQGAGA